MTGAIPARELKRLIGARDELAILDVREEGTHSLSHLFYGSCLPLSRLELRVRDMVPRLATPIVVVDDDGGELARRAATKLEAFGYTDVAVLAGGIEGWEAAGYVLFSGVHVPSKAFGEWVEHHCDTPHVDAAGLKAMLDAGEDLVVLDSRPMDEYRVMNIPGSTDVPGAELALRVHDLAPDEETTVVVNCAGRTRSIIGAQSLINAGIPNRVLALKNGTMGWHLAGFELERGQSRAYGAATPEGLARAEAVIERVVRRFGVKSIDHAGLAAWRAEADSRTLYVVDVRAAEEYEAGHFAGSLWAPGGQLVQETESWLATLGARVVLVDDLSVRAYMTASWLLQMGWEEVRVLAEPFAGQTLERGPRGYRLPSIAEAAHDQVSPKELATMLDAGAAVVVDLAVSDAYAAGHIPGAWFAVRARLATAFAKLPAAGAIVLTSPDGTIARLAAPEASELTARPVKVLAGGTAAWRAAGLALGQGLENMADVRDDVWLKPYQDSGDQEENMRRYLAWELDLVRNIERDGDHRFRMYPR